MAHGLGTTLKPLIAFGKTPADCWTWLGSHNAEGVPTKAHLGQQMPARRWLWSMLFGPIPDGLVITTMTTCGDKACMNPHHFRACSQAQANRAGVGAVLLPADVLRIRRAKKDHGPNTARVLAGEIGCSEQAIRDVWRCRTWRAAKPNHGPRRRTTAQAQTEQCA